MIEMKTSELIGPALDWAVAKAEGYIDDPESWLHGASLEQVKAGTFKPSTNWSQGGPLIEPNRISLMLRHDGWWIACVYNINDEAEYMQLAEDPLIAAMRCLAAAMLGDTVQVPQELLP